MHVCVLRALMCDILIYIHYMYYVRTTGWLWLPAGPAGFLMTDDEDDDGDYESDEQDDGRQRQSSSLPTMNG